MDYTLIDTIIKIFFINLYTLLINFKIINIKINKKKIMKSILTSVVATIIYVIVQKYIDNMLIIMIMYFVQLIFLRFEELEKENILFTANLISNTLTYIIFGISMFLELIIKLIFQIDNSVINIMFIVIIEAVLLFEFFKIRRFKDGFKFLQNRDNNGYVDIIMINISTMGILAYYLFGNYYGNFTNQLLILFIIVGIVMLIMIQKTITLYYKQRLLDKTISDYKLEIEEKDEEIKKLSEEKFKISKLNHEFYNRQKALEMKVNNFINNANTEISSEISIIENIEKLSKEYSNGLENIKGLEKLPTTEIEEIDDMFKYMQSECKKNNIDFKLQINGNINYLINKIIPQNKLVTLIGDHIRDAIIAINYSNNKFKSILVMLGIKDNFYELSIYDSGIEFEIETLGKLGIEPATTHKDTGGTGIGFMTTFETLKETKASLIINERHEMSAEDYTKSINIRFDDKNEYKICSYRAEKIKNKIKDSRIIIKNN